jgi:hypothetical protein
LGNLGFQGAEPLPHGLEIVAQPHDSHARRRHRLALREQFVGDSELAPRRLVDGHRDDHRFQLRDHPVLQIRFAAADLLQAFLAAALIATKRPSAAKRSIWRWPYFLTVASGPRGHFPNDEAATKLIWRAPRTSPPNRPAHLHCRAPR